MNLFFFKYIFNLILLSTPLFFGKKLSSKGLLLLKKNCDRACPYSCKALGVFYNYHENIKIRDITTAIYFFEKSIVNNVDAEVFNYLGVIYSDLSMDNIDYEKAFNFFLRSYEAGYVYSAYNIGWMYFNGFFVLKNNDKAKYYFEKVSNLRHEIKELKFYLNEIKKENEQ